MAIGLFTPFDVWMQKLATLAKADSPYTIFAEEPGDFNPSNVVV
jgi:hypothetical protein